MAREEPFETVAEHYLAALRAHGIERLFVNAGTDFAPLVEAYARCNETNAPPFPEPVIATHENLGIGMAHGAYLVTGKLQALMVHVSVGTANAVCGLLNAARDRIPILLTAGRSPLFERDALGARDMRIHWGQEMFDQAGMVRELVKWDYELRDARQVDDVVHRAVTIASTEPRGPIYLTLPREVLAASAASGAMADGLRPPPTAAAPDAAAMAQLADRIAAARMPVIVATASGADPETVAPLVRLCERFAIGYAEEQARYLNFPAGHRLHLGYQLAPIFEEADVLCFLECDVPWTPNGATPREDAFVAHAGVDPAFSRYPMRSHRADLSVTSSAAAFIEALAAALERRVVHIDSERSERVAALAKRLRGAQPEMPLNGPITRDAVAAALSQAVDADTLMFNEYWAPPAQLARTKPQTYFYLSSAGGLGWALPAALGAQLAAPERTVVALIGDGAYLFANPAACHQVAARYDLPVLTIVYNNARWGAVDLAAQLVYPDGRWRDAGAPSLSDLAPIPALERYVEASGGYGERVDAAAQLMPALQRALHTVRVERRQAVLNVIGA